MIRALWNRIVSAILDAQKAVGPAEDDTLAPALATPDLVGALVARDQYDEQTIATRPVRSTKADAKRAAHQYAEQRAGHPLSWKAARKLLNQWERLERAAAVADTDGLLRVAEADSHVHWHTLGSVVE